MADAFGSMRVADLKKELGARGLATSGRKPVLLKRLREAEAEEEIQVEQASSSDSDDVFVKHKKQRTSKRGSKRKEPSTDGPSQGRRTSRRQAERKENYVDPDANDWDLEWNVAENGDPTFMFMTSTHIKGSSLIAAYDYDWTIGNPTSGKFANGRNDWVWWNEAVPGHLKKLYDEGYKIVFFTNQAGIEKRKTTFAVLQGKFIDISKELGFPIQVFISGATNHWRKPHTSMWDFMITNCNDGVKPDLNKSIYVGDAAGRKKEWDSGKKKDFSVSDRKFAANIGIRFETPEEHFHGESATKKFDWRAVNPKTGMDPNNYEDVKEFESSSSIASDSQEVILFCGFPSAGKSTFAQRYLIPKGYEWVNRDTLKTPAKCIKATKAAVKDGKSVVVDNTSPTVSDRDRYLSVAESAGVPCRCFWFQTPREICEHLNFIREKQTNGARRRVPPVGFNTYKSRFAEPTTDEGFTEVVKINFVPNFDTENDRKIFALWS